MLAVAGRPGTAAIGLPVHLASNGKSLDADINTINAKQTALNAPQRRCQPKVEI
jgi:hypothetical protein